MITSTSNALIKRIRKLEQKKFRMREGCGFVEGLRGVLTAAECAKHLIEKVIVAPELLAQSTGETRLRGLVPSEQIVEVSAGVFRSVSGRENPIGVGAIVQSPLTSIQAMTPTETNMLYIILDRVGDPGNLGTIIRTADAAGAAGVVLTGAGVDVMHPSALKASLGTVFTVPISSASVDELSQWKKAQNVTLIGSSAKADSHYQHVQPTGAVGLLLGNERLGLSEELSQLADETVTIPMGGQASSLNLAVAAGILIFQFKQE